MAESKSTKKEDQMAQDENEDISKEFDNIKDINKIDLSKISDKDLSNLIFRLVKIQGLKLDLINKWC